MNIAVLNGPNLNLLGERNPEQYGSQSLEDLKAEISNYVGDRHVLRFFQSNHEGDLIDYLHENRKWAEGFIINPGAFTHYSYALRDAIEAVDTPCVEVHLSDIENREDFRKISVTKEVCVAQIKGKGFISYLDAIDILEQNF